MGECWKRNNIAKCQNSGLLGVLRNLNIQSPGPMKNVRNPNQVAKRAQCMGTQRRGLALIVGLQMAFAIEWGVNHHFTSADSGTLHALKMAFKLPPLKAS